MGKWRLCARSWNRQHHEFAESGMYRSRRRAGEREGLFLADCPERLGGEFFRASEQFIKSFFGQIGGMGGCQRRHSAFFVMSAILILSDGFSSLLFG